MKGDLILCPSDTIYKPFSARFEEVSIFLRFNHLRKVLKIYLKAV